MFATKLKEHDERLLKQGIEQGIEQGIGESIKRMRRKGLSAIKIAELLDIPAAQVDKYT